MAELDGLRFLAATSVFLYHGLTPVPAADEYIGRWLVHLNLGVRVFYVLSGFLIALPFARANLGATQQPRLASYAIRRVARVYPAYWIALASSMLITGRRFHSLHDAVGQITLTFFWLPQQGRAFTIIGVSGTVVIEVAFYALVPLLFAMLLGAQRLLPRVDPLVVQLAGLGAVLGLGALATWRSAFGEPGLAVREGGTALPALATGMVVATLAAASVDRPALDAGLRRVVRPVGIWWCAALACFAVLASRPLRFLSPTPSQVAWQLPWELVVATLLVAPVALGGASSATSAVGRFLRIRVVAWLGLISYGLYLWHGFFISHIGGARLARHGAFGTTRAVVLVAATFAASVAVAAASWYVVERPVQQWAARVAPGDDGRRSPVGLLRRRAHLDG